MGPALRRARRLPTTSPATSTAARFRSGLPRTGSETDRTLLSGALRLSILVGSSFVVGLAINVFLVPPDAMLGAVYAIPILVAARRLPPGAVCALSVLSIGLYSLNAYLRATSDLLWVFGLGALMTIDLLAVWLALERQQVLRHSEQLLAAHWRLRTFMDVVSHELRNPLTTLLGYVQLLSTSSIPRDSEIRERALEITDQASWQMLRLIDDLRDAALITSTDLSIRPVPMDLVATTREVAGRCLGASELHRLVLAAPSHLEGAWDHVRIRQVLTNLLNNAVKYSPEGGEIQVTVERRGDLAIVSIADPGLGITPDQLPYLFEPFTRLHQKHSMIGMGLGLYISKALVEAHGGSILVESAPSRGSTFTVALPVRVRAPEPPGG